MWDTSTHKILICDGLIDRVAVDPRFIEWYIKKRDHMHTNYPYFQKPVNVQSYYKLLLNTIRLIKIPPC
jgi:hypothetical protein